MCASQIDFNVTTGWLLTLFSEVYCYNATPQIIVFTQFVVLQFISKFQMVVTLPDPFRGMGAWKNCRTETQQE